MESMVDFWKGKKVFITGHTGFKGSWLSLWLQSLQAHVIGYALDPPSTVNLFTEANVANDMIDLRGDIRDYQHVLKALDEHQPEIIFHLAAQSLVRYSYPHPVETYSVNVMGTVHMLEAARHCQSVKAIVNVTTDKCYENNETKQAYLETDPLGGHDPYSSSKACSELATTAYRNSYFTQAISPGLASARAGNVIGGGDWASDRLIPDIITACINEKPIQLRYPEAIRPWQHVLESLAGYLKLAELLFHEPMKYSQAWNFGPNTSDDRTVQWVVDNVLALWGNVSTLLKRENSNLHEATHLMLNSDKAHTQLQWSPKWDIQQALHATVDWYREYYAGSDAKKLSMNQIIEYMQSK